ncbi:MAG: hypothetical protein ACM3S5_08650 [Rhodospirillales bacterium]
MRFDVMAEPDVDMFEHAKLNGKPAFSELPKTEPTPWPKPLADAAYHGIVGELIRQSEPHTEADPAALLVQFLLGFGNLVGRTPYFRVGADHHYLNLFGVLVGRSSKGRKGTAWSAVRFLLQAMDEEWAVNRQVSGLSSGEGLIWAVRDQIEEQEAIREPKTKRITGYQTIVTDQGVSDKRLMVVEPEFASALRVAERDGNTLSAVLRQGWDTGTLRILTRNKPAKATGAHISVIGHVTKDELLKYLSSTEAANGFANRFMWVCVRRSKLLPEGGGLHTVDFGPILRRLENAVRFSRTVGELSRDEEARKMWCDAYTHLTAERTGMLGAVTSRAEAITLRLACLYALLDCCPQIRVPHLAAALEVWRYCEDSARFIFGDALGDATADGILEALRNRPEGMTRTELRDLFDRHKPTSEIGRALGVLRTAGLVRCETEQTGGRPIERWYSR